MSLAAAACFLVQQGIHCYWRGKAAQVQTDKTNPNGFAVRWRNDQLAPETTPLIDLAKEEDFLQADAEAAFLFTKEVNDDGAASPLTPQPITTSASHQEDVVSDLPTVSNRDSEVKGDLSSRSLSTNAQRNLTSSTLYAKGYALASRQPMTADVTKASVAGTTSEFRTPTKSPTKQTRHN